MANELADVDYEKFWRRLQQVGLNAYEARSYVVLVGHPRFKALELAARARVPRQKIYEVLDSLVEKGFAQVVQEKTKLFSAVEPGLAIPAYLERQKEDLEQQLDGQRRHGQSLAADLRTAYAEGQGGRGTLDYLRIVNDPSQIAVHYRSMLSGVEREFIEFSRPPYAVDPLDEQLVKQAAARGVRSRILVESGALDDEHRDRLQDYKSVGVEVREVLSLPLKLALFDCSQGLVALLDPVITRPAWTAVVFDHGGFAEAMAGLFEERWRRAITH
ncbi:helix-turn-helix domain-containing protein [uncultured Paludibaculum sp.]|uniref:TrmB family transcriptional regulator n=1 Tax=uncultured Paludibaculum sp. TaxID=1765020 RepID=UPI002AAC07EB|nr:helix-turn-helix domain-containing protein [uncultured Paludibaculum sp.]